MGETIKEAYARISDISDSLLYGKESYELVWEDAAMVSTCSQTAIMTWKAPDPE